MSESPGIALQKDGQCSAVTGKSRLNLPRGRNILGTACLTGFILLFRVPVWMVVRVEDGCLGLTEFFVCLDDIGTTISISDIPAGLLFGYVTNCPPGAIVVGISKTKLSSLAVIP
jgi:hypothetical protein